MNPFETLKCPRGLQCVWVKAVRKTATDRSTEEIYYNINHKKICNYLHPNETLNKMLIRTGVCDTTT